MKNRSRKNYQNGSQIRDSNNDSLNRFKERRRRQDLIFTVFIIILTICMTAGYYFYYIIGDSGSSNENQEDDNYGNSGPSTNHGGDEIEWVLYDEGLEAAKNQNKPVMVDFYFDGCVWCDELEKNTYSDTRVIQKAKSFVCVKVDAYEQNEYDGGELTEQYNVDGFPTIVFLNPNGNEIKRIEGYAAPGPFLEDMDYALANS